MMSMETGRRQVVQAGAAAAVVAPLVGATPAEAKMDKSGRAPVITVFDHRGCQRGGANKEYTGAKANGQDDEMCVKVENPKIAASESRAAAQLAESISFKAKGIDGAYTGKAAFQSFNDAQARSMFDQSHTAMNMETGRREVIQAGAAAAVVAPLVGATPAEAKMDKSNRAPVITIFDHRGCQRGGANKEYTGAKVNGPEDEMCVKVENPKIAASESRAAAQLAEAISFQA